MTAEEARREFDAEVTWLPFDLHPEYRQIVIASPCSSHGFKFAPVTGQMLADLAVNGATPFPTARFRLDRPALAESWSATKAAVVGRE